ncbi:glycogen synthase GlgA [Urechidicola sp. KH5]
MKILHLSAECYPIAKVGGLADVVGSLPKYQSNGNSQSEVIMPLYDNAFTHKNEYKTIYNSTLELGNQNLAYQIVTLKENTLGFNIYFIKIPNLLFVDYVYSSDDTNRFLAFQIAALDWVLTWDEKPNLFHCHDHHVGLAPFMLQESYKYESLNKIPVVLTIHNAQYQGWFSHEKVGLIPAFNFDHVGLLDWGGAINPLAAAIKCAWAVTTVSPSYMEELKLAANGLESLLASEHAKCSGILNGIDTDVWNPETDNYIIKNFKKSTVVSGRKGNKKWLCDEFGLDESKPLFAFIGRLVGEKGADLLPSAFKEALASENISVLLLGSGHKNVESELNEIKQLFPNTYNNYIGYDERLSHIIYAGADFLIMPSRVEPCGLNQLYSLRYGLIPVVRSIGGLKDTVIDIDNNGFGFVHQKVEVKQIVQAIERATNFYNDTPNFTKIRKAIMDIDHSWNASAKAYIKLYNTLKK